MVNEDECRAAGLDVARIKSIARRLRNVGIDAKAMGLTIFGGSGSGSLRFHDGAGAALVVADINGGRFDGGDGAAWRGNDGLLRGES